VVTPTNELSVTSASVAGTRSNTVTGCDSATVTVAVSDLMVRAVGDTLATVPRTMTAAAAVSASAPAADAVSRRPALDPPRHAAAHTAAKMIQRAELDRTIAIIMTSRLVHRTFAGPTVLHVSCARIGPPRHPFDRHILTINMKTPYPHASTSEG